MIFDQFPQQLGRHCSHEQNPVVAVCKQCLMQFCQTCFFDPDANLEHTHLDNETQITEIKTLIRLHKLQLGQT